MVKGEALNIVTFLAGQFQGSNFYRYFYLWENVIFSLIVVFIISITAYFASRKIKMVPGRLQNAAEILVGGLDEFVCGILGDKGRKYLPFIGALFIYILCMNLIGLIPFMKSSTANWSTTMALALCVFIYVQYAAFKELGVRGYLSHLSGNLKGGLVYSVILPLMMLVLHVLTELIRPITLSLRLRSNVWGDDVLLAVLAGFGIKGIPLLIFSTILAIISSIVQAAVFCLLTTIYFALIVNHEEETPEHV